MQDPKVHPETTLDLRLHTQSLIIILSGTCRKGYL